MEQKTFTIQVSFLSKTATGQLDESGAMIYEDQKVSKNATFKELDQKDRSQLKLQALIASVFQNFSIKQVPGEATKMNIDTDGVIDITLRMIDDLLVLDSEFTKQDKGEVMIDNMALIDLGWKLLTDQVAPFFFGTRKNSGE